MCAVTKVHDSVMSWADFFFEGRLVCEGICLVPGCSFFSLVELVRRTMFCCCCCLDIENDVRNKNTFLPLVWNPSYLFLHSIDVRNSYTVILREVPAKIVLFIANMLLHHSSIHKHIIMLR